MNILFILEAGVVVGALAVMAYCYRTYKVERHIFWLVKALEKATEAVEIYVFKIREIDQILLDEDFRNNKYKENINTKVDNIIKLVKENNSHNV